MTLTWKRAKLDPNIEIAIGSILGHLSSNFFLQIFANAPI